MAAQKRNLKNILNRPMTTKDATSLWTNDYSIDFKPDYERLVRRHQVPVVNKYSLEEGKW